MNAWVAFVAGLLVLPAAWVVLVCVDMVLDVRTRTKGRYRFWPVGHLIVHVAYKAGVTKYKHPRYSFWYRHLLRYFCTPEVRKLTEKHYYLETGKEVNGKRGAK
jgi:hypothetical protein